MRIFAKLEIGQCVTTVG